MVGHKIDFTPIGFMLLALFLLTPGVGADQLTGRLAKVIDGDTVAIEVEGGQQTVHLFGIDAPELEQPYGGDAIQALAPLVGSAVKVRVISATSDELTGTVVANDRDVAQMLIEEGCAWIVEDGPTNDSYVVALFSARREGRGLWAEEDPIHPAKWRRAHTTVVKKKAKGLSDVAAVVALEKDANGRTRIDSSDIPPQFSRDAEGKLFVERMIQIAQVARWMQTAQQLQLLYCDGSASATGDGSVWSEKVNPWASGSIAPAGCFELKRQIIAAQSWIQEAKKTALEDAGRGGVAQGDMKFVIDALDLEDQPEDQ